MMSPEFYLGAGRFTGLDYNVKCVADEIAGATPLEAVEAFVRTMPREPRKYLYRNRTAGDILRKGPDSYAASFRDAADEAIAFAALARAHGIPAAYVEAVDREFLHNPRGKVPNYAFVDVFIGGEWVPYNPRAGRTERSADGVCLLLVQGSRVAFTEVGRGLDFSGIYAADSTNPVELLTRGQVVAFAEKVAAGRQMEIAIPEVLQPHMSARGAE